MPRGVKGYCRIRVVDRIAGVEITNDLPHLHQSTFTVESMQPGNPSSVGLGSFTVPLHPPGSRGYRNAKAIYDQLALNHRLEFYVTGDGASMGGQPRFAGPIRNMPSNYGTNGDNFELDGVSDLFWANYSMPFPGEFLSNDITSNILQSYMGTNEPGWMDTFNPFTAGNYTSVALPGGTAGSWSGTTDDGFHVAKCSSGTSAALISKVGAAANDRWHSQFVECIGRIQPSSDTGNAGTAGVGITTSPGSAGNSVIGFVQPAFVAGRYVLNAFINRYTGGVLITQRSATNVLLNVEDPQGLVPISIGLLVTTGGQSASMASAALTVNGKVVLIHHNVGYDPGTTTNYPCLVFATPATGSAACYLTNLVQMTRFSADGPSAAASFAPGSITASTHSLGYGTDPGPSFLDIWSRLATREGWYWRYTPQAYVPGSRTLGLVDFAADPGRDLSQQVIFSRDNGNLVHLGLSGNSDPFMSGTTTASVPSLDGGGIGIWRDIGTMSKSGIFEDQTVALSSPDFNTVRRYALQISANKIAIGVGGSKLATVLRDPSTVDKCRELDRVLIDDPLQNVNKLPARILSYIFTEAVTTEDLVLDQFGA